jgi:glycosyltransferase involved in cell wall biosynthesis
MIYAIFPHTTKNPAQAVREIKRRGKRPASFGFQGVGASIESRSITSEEVARDFLAARSLTGRVVEFDESQFTVREFNAPPVLDKVRENVALSKSPDRSADKVKPCDVLSVFFHDFPTWVQTRGVRLGEFLGKRDIEHDFFFTRHETSAQDIEKAIRASGCKVFLNELCVTRPHVIESLAQKFPSVRFVSIFHAAPNYTSTQPDWKERTFDTLLATTRSRNIVAATVMPADRFDDFKGAKVVSLPNFFELPEGIQTPTRGDRPFTLSLVGRRDVVKGTHAAVSTICRLHQRRDDVGALLISNKFDDGDRARIAYEGVRASFVKWGDWQEYLQLIANTVDVGLQYSLTESFNLVALEHLALGKPVIGSHAIEYLPKKWKVNPQDPAEGARVAEDIFDNLEEESARAVRTAKRVSKKCNETFLDNINTLLNS